MFAFLALFLVGFLLCASDGGTDDRDDDGWTGGLP